MKLGVWIIGILLIFGLGMGTEYYLGHRTTMKMETTAPQVWQKDGSLILARVPDATATPKQEIPKGDVVERIGKIVVQSKSNEAPGATNGNIPLGAEKIPALPPTPMTIDWSLVKEPDGNQRMIVSSPDGTIVGGVDIPVAPIVTPKPLLWSAGVVYGIKSGGGSEKGIFVDRTVLKYVKTGVEVCRETYSNSAGWDARVKIGINF
jgi:hypothetical protein